MFTNVLARIWQKRKPLIIATLIVVGVYGAYQPLPTDFGLAGEVYELADQSVQFLVDETYSLESGEVVMQQTIFDEVLTLIDEAESYILVDMFLWNSFQGVTPETHRRLSSELTEALLRKKQQQPEMSITVVSDPINTIYEGQPAYHFEQLKASGIPVILTNHTEMRDSNPLYSSVYRAFLQWPDRAHQALIGEPYTIRFMPNLLDSNGESITVRSYLKLFNFKANHRKLLVADAPSETGRSLVSLVTSANPHDGSSRHSNVALRIEGGVWRDIIKSEQMVANFSGGTVPAVLFPERYTEVTGEVGVNLITEQSIQQAVLEMLEGVGSGGTVKLAMFYLSEDKIVEALIAASDRGASVQVILDPNKDAFGREKNGVPNRPVAARLLRETNGDIEVRWCATVGEQCHSKLLLVSTADNHVLTLGSANFTRRNLNNLNLETNVLVRSTSKSLAHTDAEAFFDRMWRNEAGRNYTVAYEVYKDESIAKRLQSWVMENTGLSTF